MRDVTRKLDTLRTATAQATVNVGPDGLAALKGGTLPKGEPFGICQAAGMLAGKKTSELIPHCHNIPLDSLDVRCELTGTGVTITAEAKTVWKTGVEMEALTAASVAALTLYDLLKPIETNVVIAETKLLSVKGGKTQFEGMFAEIKPSYAVLVASDRASAGTYDDASGKKIMEILNARGGSNQFYKVLPDDPDGLAEQMREWAGDVDFIFTTGGTGIAPRDAMVEATLGVIEREVPGIAEAMRGYSQRRKPLAMFSRGTVGTIGKTMIINLPGSPKGVEECLDALLPYVFHAVSELAKDGPVARLSSHASANGAHIAPAAIEAPPPSPSSASIPVVAPPPPPVVAPPPVSYAPPPPPPMATPAPMPTPVPMGAQPAAGPRFDPVTGAPLAPPSPPAHEPPRTPRFDPVTGAPLPDTQVQQTPSFSATPATPSFAAPPPPPTPPAAPSLADPFGANIDGGNPEDTAMFTIPPP